MIHFITLPFLFFIFYFIISSVLPTANYLEWVYNGQLSFQDSSLPIFEGIINLHHDIFYILIFIVIFVITIILYIISYWNNENYKHPFYYESITHQSEVSNRGYKLIMWYIISYWNNKNYKPTLYYESITHQSEVSDRRWGYKLILCSIMLVIASYNSSVVYLDEAPNWQVSFEAPPATLTLLYNDIFYILTVIFIFVITIILNKAFKFYIGFMLILMVCNWFIYIFCNILSLKSLQTTKQILDSINRVFFVYLSKYMNYCYVNMFFIIMSMNCVVLSNNYCKGLLFLNEYTVSIPLVFCLLMDIPYFFLLFINWIKSYYTNKMPENNRLGFWNILELLFGSLYISIFTFICCILLFKMNLPFSILNVSNNNCIISNIYFLDIFFGSVKIQRYLDTQQVEQVLVYLREYLAILFNNKGNYLTLYFSQYEPVIKEYLIANNMEEASSVVNRFVRRYDAQYNYEHLNEVVRERLLKRWGLWLKKIWSYFF